MQALDKLNVMSYEAYIVGGCVRDSLLGRKAQDWDITTNATPAEMKACFAEYNVVETGLKHGTLTVIVDNTPIEITAYRTDGNYSDHRRPDSVAFTGELKEDLRRRDFTVNAMAYHPKTGLIDYFGGRGDLTSRRIKCVGDARQRFSEDALRILRAARFSAALGFEIEAGTRAAMHELRALLNHVSAERIAVELNKTLMGEYCENALLENEPVFTHIMPELSKTVGFLQNTPYHHFDVWRHTVKSVAATPYDLTVRLAMLLHDAGKPQTYSTDENGVGHFYGHAAVSAKIADEVLARLRYDNATHKRVVDLISWHCDKITPDAKLLKRRLNRIGEDALRQLLAVVRADRMAKAPGNGGFENEARLGELDEAERLLEEIIKERQCVSLSELAVNGGDLLTLGFAADKKLGETLNKLLSLVIDEKLPNEREALLKAAKTML